MRIGGATTDRKTDINEYNDIDTPRDAECCRGAEPVTEEVTQTPVLITEQEVAFSTATVPVRHAKTRRGLTAVLRGIFVNSTANAEKPRRHYPPRRNSLLEHTAMAREMHRL
jgi:hypothetical protein